MVTEAVYQRAVRVLRELELGVGDDDAALARMLGGEFVDADRGVPYARRELGTDDTRRLLEADGLVVRAHGRLGRRREQRLRQPRGLLQSGG